MKVFSSDIKIGFLASANALKEKLLTNQIVDETQIINAQKMIFNQQLVAFIAMFFLIILWIVIFESVRKIFFGKNK
jgi:carbon starvation protein